MKLLKLLRVGALQMNSLKKTFSYFLVIWLGDLFSTIGSGLTAFSLGVFAYQLTNEATSTSMVVLCTFLPAFLVRPIGGVLADRFDRPLLMICGNIGSAVGIGFIVSLLTLSSNHLSIIYTGIIISSVFFGLQNPAYKASVSDFLPENLYSKGSGLLQLSNAAQFLIAPLLGGILMSLMSITSVLLLDIFTFIFSALSIIYVKSKTKMRRKSIKKEKFTFLSEIKIGINEILSKKSILFLVILVSILLFYVGLIQTLLTPMILSFESVRVLGIIQSTCAIGMLISSICISTITRRIKSTNVLAVSLALMGFSFAFIGIKNNIYAVIIPGFIFFSAIPFANSSIEVLIRQNTDNDLQGRIWSIISVFTYFGAMLSYSISGFLADHIFNPLFMTNGFFTENLGRIFGVGPGRGIAFMFFISGMVVMLISVLVYKSKKIKSLEQSISYATSSIDYKESKAVQT